MSSNPPPSVLLQVSEFYSRMLYRLDTPGQPGRRIGGTDYGCHHLQWLRISSGDSNWCLDTKIMSANINVGQLKSVDGKKVNY